MPEKPSILSSTTTQLLFASVLVYGLGTVILMVKGTITTLEPAQWLVNVLLPLYAIRSGIKSVTNGGTNGTAEVPAPTPEAPAHS